jgi:hypothetical protein
MNSTPPKHATLLVVKVGNNDRPAEQTDIDAVAKAVREAIDGDGILVTYHAVQFETVAVPVSFDDLLIEADGAGDPGDDGDPEAGDYDPEGECDPDCPCEEHAHDVKTAGLQDSGDGCDCGGYDCYTCAGVPVRDSAAIKRAVQNNDVPGLVRAVFEMAFSMGRSKGE